MCTVCVATRFDWLNKLLRPFLSQSEFIKIHNLLIIVFPRLADSFECLRSLVLAAHSNYFECVSRYSIGKDWKPTYLEVKGKSNTINQSYTAVINYPSNYAFSLLIALCISYGDKKKKLVEYLATCQLIMSDYVKS